MLRVDLDVRSARSDRGYDDDRSLAPLEHLNRANSDARDTAFVEKLSDFASLLVIRLHEECKCGDDGLEGEGRGRGGKSTEGMGNDRTVTTPISSVLTPCARMLVICSTTAAASKGLNHEGEFPSRTSSPETPWKRRGKPPGIDRACGVSPAH